MGGEVGVPGGEGQGGDDDGAGRDGAAAAAAGPSKAPANRIRPAAYFLQNPSWVSSKPSQDTSKLTSKAGRGAQSRSNDRKG